MFRRTLADRVDRTSSPLPRNRHRWSTAFAALALSAMVAPSLVGSRAVAAPRGKAAKAPHAKATSAKRTTTSPAARAKTAGRASAATRRAPKVAAPVPNQSGKIAVLTFRGDDGDDIRDQVARLLRKRGLDVTTELRPVDTAVQYRDMAATLNLAAYVEGDVRGDEQRGRAKLQVRSGLSGRRIASTTLSETWNRLPSEIDQKLWSKLGAALAHSCAAASKYVHRRRSSPMRINAGTPLETRPWSSWVPTTTRPWRRRRTGPSARVPRPKWRRTPARTRPPRAPGHPRPVRPGQSRARASSALRDRNVDERGRFSGDRGAGPSTGRRGIAPPHAAGAAWGPRCRAGAVGKRVGPRQGELLPRAPKAR